MAFRNGEVPLSNALCCGERRRVSREKKIIAERFGLGGEKPKTLEDVAKNFAVTRERIRQLQNVALAKLRRALGKKETALDAQLLATV